MESLAVLVRIRAAGLAAVLKAGRLARPRNWPIRRSASLPPMQA
ncbi:UNVERIFIED_CONTAM: hypothetical protein GTU68_026840 [Idotea baltica]|nr:hypothetical protein [Idotea baltica]